MAIQDALHEGRHGVRARGPPLLGLPVEPAARDRPHGVDDVGLVGEGEDDRVVPLCVAPQLDVVDRICSTHEAVYGSCTLGSCSRASMARSALPPTRGSRSTTRASPAGTAPSRSPASTAAVRTRWRTTTPACGRTSAGLRLPYDEAALRTEVDALLAEAGPVEGLLRIVLTRGGRRVLTVEPLPHRRSGRARDDRDLRAQPRARRAQDALLRGQHALGPAGEGAGLRRGAARDPARARARGPDVELLLGRRRRRSTRRRSPSGSSARSRARR